MMMFNLKQSLIAIALVGSIIGCASGTDNASNATPTIEPPRALATVSDSVSIVGNPTLPPAVTATNTLPPDLYTPTPSRTPLTTGLPTRDLNATSNLRPPTTDPNATPTPTTAPTGTRAQVVNVIDGDTIDVMIDGATFRVRYISVNTPERDEPCYAESTAANRALVENQTVLLVKDVSETDQYGRLLRYIYVGNTFVEAELVANGFAEVVRYRPDDTHFQTLKALEQEAAAAGYGCHPTGIFDDNTYER